MILKNMDTKDTDIKELERLISIAPSGTKQKIEQELRNMQAGIKAEQEAAYLIDFYLKESARIGVIHDLRLVIDGRVAQIDHLLIHRTLNAYVLETKSFHSGVKIAGDGEFLRWNHFAKAYEGMASPMAQNERHIAVLEDAFKNLDLPKRLGLRLSPVLKSYILVSKNARIDRPKHFDTSQIIKADLFMKQLDESVEKAGVLDILGRMSRIVSKETLEEIGHKLIALHEPAKFHYAERFGITEHKSVESKQTCRNCGSDKVFITYGRYGYYFKCKVCSGNTPIQIGCGSPGHKEKVRKDGRNFYRECADCNTSSLFFINPAFAN